MELLLIILMPIIALIAIVYWFASELKCKAVAKVWIIYSCMIIPLSIFFIPFFDGTTKVMFGINEKVQDLFGDMPSFHNQLENAYNSGAEHGYIGKWLMYHRTKEDNLCVNLLFSRSSQLVGKIFFVPDGKSMPTPPSEEWKPIAWNKNLLFMSDYKGVKDYLSWYYSRYNRIYILQAVLVAIQCIFFFFIFKKSFDKVNVFLLLLLISIIPIISLKNFGSNYLLTDNPYSKAESMMESFTKNDINFTKMMKDIKKVSKQNLSYKANSELKVFVSKKAFFPHDYVRINLDLFNYLFYFPDDKKINVNPLMDFKKLRKKVLSVFSWIDLSHVRNEAGCFKYFEEEIIHVAEPITPAFYHLDFIVNSFRHAICYLMGKVCQNSVFPAIQPFC